jgi:Fe2+ transport system protein FeoA
MPVMTPNLWSLRSGDSCEILGYDDALDEKYRVRLMEFGFHTGESVSCLQSLAFGAPKVYRVSNTVYSLDDEVATHVLVRVTPPHA